MPYFLIDIFFPYMCKFATLFTRCCCCVCVCVCVCLKNWHAFQSSFAKYLVSVKVCSETDFVLTNPIQVRSVVGFVLVKELFQKPSSAAWILGAVRESFSGVWHWQDRKCEIVFLVDLVTIRTLRTAELSRIYKAEAGRERHFNDWSSLGAWAADKTAKCSCLWLYVSADIKDGPAESEMGPIDHSVCQISPSTSPYAVLTL